MSSAKRPRHGSSSVGASNRDICPSLNAHKSATHEFPFVISGLDTPQIQEGTESHTRMPAKAPLPARLGHIRPGGSVRHQRLSQEDDEDSEKLDEDVIMAVEASSKGSIGCCYYLAEESRLLVMSDINGGESTETLEQLKLHVQPTMVLLSLRGSRTVESLFDCRTAPKLGGHDRGESFRLPYRIDYRPSTEFAYEAGKTRLTEIQPDTNKQSGMAFVTPGYGAAYEDSVQQEGLGLTQRHGKLLRLAAAIDMDSRLSVGCAGAVLAFIGRLRTRDHTTHDRDRQLPSVFKMEMFSMADLMFINTDTLASLQILSTESSPNAHSQGPAKGVSGAKEGLSVYGLFHNFAKTPQGRHLLRQYFLRPTLDLETINGRLDFVSVFSQQENESSLRALVKNLGQITNMRSTLTRLRKGIGNATEKGSIKSGIWSNIRLVSDTKLSQSLHVMLRVIRFAYHSLQIRDILTEMPAAGRLRLAHKVYERFDKRELARVGEHVNATVDFEASHEMHRTVVKPGVDLDLDTLKKNYHGMDDMLNLTTSLVAHTMPDEYADIDLNVIFFPQIGFLICLPLDPEMGLAVSDGSAETALPWDRIFSTPERVYFKDWRMRDLDDTWGDVYAQICDREIEIVYNLGQLVLEAEEILNSVSDVCGELDRYLGSICTLTRRADRTSLQALAQAARKYNLCRPEVTQQNVIDLRGGRHLLQELTVPCYIPNDARIVGASGDSSMAASRYTDKSMIAAPAHAESQSTSKHLPSLLMMTGPNYSGKSVYLKQIAIIVYMAHIGSFVPADRALIGLTDKILTRIATRETASKMQSAFLTDLQQVVLAATLATRRSLVIIDEFGKGTDLADGAALACAIFEHFLRLRDAMPKVLGATHFHEIFESGYLRPGPKIAFGHMEVRVDRTEKLEEQVTYLYTFQPGREVSSHGSYCAAINGIDGTIIARSRQLEEWASKGEDLVGACAKVSDEEEEDLKMAEIVARDFLAMDFRRPALDERESHSTGSPRRAIDELDLGRTTKAKSV